MMDSAQQLIDTQLGTATLKRLVGSGGMGMVFLAHQAHLDRDVAIKVLRAGMDMLSEQNEEFLKRFRREAHVIAQLDHINILPIYEYGEENGLPFLVMPYLTGGSLHDRLQKAAPLPMREAMLYIEQAGSALEYAHAHKIVHRDIKPRNMLFHADGRLVLVDFGIAHILHDEHDPPIEHTITDSGNFIGSAGYMAPEMVNGQAVDFRTDIYELGVVIFQMLTGRLPFLGSTPFVIAAQHLHEPVPSLVELNPILTEGIDAVVRKAMAKHPATRYSSTHELIQELRTEVSRAETLAGSRRRLSLPGLTEPKKFSLISLPLSGEMTQKIPMLEGPSTGGSRAEVAQGAHTNKLSEEELNNAFAKAHLSVNGAGEKAAISPQVAPVQTTGDEHDRYIERKRKRWIGTGIILCICVLLLSIGLFASSGVLRRAQASAPYLASPTMVPQKKSQALLSRLRSPDRQAQQVVRLYYNDIDQQQYQAAYNLWSSAYQSTYSFSQFSQGFVTTQRDDIVVQASKTLPSGRVQVAIILYATDKQHAGSMINAYQGSYTLDKENGAWKLVKATLTPVQVPSPVPALHQPVE
jgi:serine/threonine protein kinase